MDTKIDTVKPSGDESVEVFATTYKIEHASTEIRFKNFF